MDECENLRRCSFFEIMTRKHKQELALAGFKKIYCLGEKQNQCMRKIVAKELGPEFIPMNMMPNGLPLTGTDDSEWEPELKTFIRDRFLRSRSK